MPLELNRVKTLLSAFLLLTLCLTDHSAKADINVNWDQPLVRKKTPPYVGGTMITYHTFPSPFVTRTPIDYQSELRTAKSKMVRLGMFPDPRKDQSISAFDDKVKAIQSSGAVPLFYAPIEPGLNYYKANGTLGGGTPASNIVYLVKRYKQAPYYLNTQYWQVGNEPDLTNVDYQVKTKDEYANTFNSIHNALISTGIRNNVKLAGPAIAYGYHLPSSMPLNTVKGTDRNSQNYQYVFRNEIMDTFLAKCNQAVDIVTFNTYSALRYGNWAYGLLNEPASLDNKVSSRRRVVSGNGNSNSSTTDRGLASLLNKMNQYSFARSPGIGITEHSTSGPSLHTIYQGLWQLILTHHVLYNNTKFPGILDNSFLFDAFGNQYSGFGHFDSNKVRDYSYWALWIRGNLTGTSGVLNVTQSNHLNPWKNPHLVVTATKGSGYMYLEVINRSSSGITETVKINGVGVKKTSAIIYQMYQGRTPNSWTSRYLGTQFSFYFPAYSATIIQIPV